MTDVVSKITRSKMMSGIRGKNTVPELIIRKGLHSKGFRYRLHYKKLPGKPDIVLPANKAIVLVNGCFWHGHNCHLFKWPSTNAEFWKDKITNNKRRDDLNIALYMDRGWKVLIVWECCLRGRARWPVASVLDLIAEWIRDGQGFKEIMGTV